jgi:poly-gamma-glutamate synthesis protein (capsule biosynthesis protein)
VKKLIKAVKYGVFPLCLLCLFGGCKEPDTVAPRIEEQPPPAPKISTLTIVAAGDNLIHDIIYLAQRLPGAEESYNFDSCYEHIKPLIERADLAFVNQETIMGGKALGHSGYPVFNTPQENGDALVKAGFDVINQASNHSLDKGEAAVFNTMDYWDKRRDVSYLGLFRTAEDRANRKTIVEKNGIKVGFLSYTYGLNGFSLPKDKPWLVPLIDTAVMAGEIDALRPLCDLLVVSMHWGNEFSHEISLRQKELALFMAEHRVDLILGHHPHVTGPMHVIFRPDGGRLVCYYSLGDFISHTQSDRTPDTMLGALAYVRVKKTSTAPSAGESGKSTTTIEEARAIPTVSHYGKGRRPPFTVYPLYDYSDELAALHYKNTTLDYLKGVSLKIFSIYMLNENPFKKP